MVTDEGAYRRNISRNTQPLYNTSPKRSSTHNRYSSQGINLRSLKEASLNCAKNITNKIINLSHNGVTAASSAIHSYREGVAQRQAEIANNPNSLKNIADRLSISTENISSHRELVAVIERMLTWSNTHPMDIQLERDKFGAPTKESIDKLSIINTFLLEKVLSYVIGRRDCCIFIIKFVTWRMRTTKHPEEIILSLELLGSCVERMGPYFLSLMTKACMRTLRRLIFMTTMKHSIAAGMRKQITKLLGKTAYVHPGISTDPRIHVFKSKTLYMIQLWYDVFLLDLPNFPVFFEGYKDMRSRGIKFPVTDSADKLKINKDMPVAILSSRSPSMRSNFLSSSGIRLPLSPDELDNLLSIVQRLSTLDRGEEYDRCINYLRCTKDKIISCINILGNDTNDNNSRLLEKMLNLNDAISTHLELSLSAGKILQSYTDKQQDNDINLLNLESSDGGEADEDEFFSKNIEKYEQDDEIDLFDFDFNTRNNNSSIKNDIDDFANHWNNNNNKTYCTSDSKIDYFDDLNTIAFNTTSVPPEVTSTVGLADSVPLASTRGLADSSSNYLPLKSIATPGDRVGSKGNEDVTSSGLPVADLREAKGEVNREGRLQDNDKTSSGEADGRTTKDADWTSAGMKSGTGPRVEPEENLMEAAGGLNSGSSTQDEPRLDREWKERASSGRFDTNVEKNEEKDAGVRAREDLNELIDEFNNFDFGHMSTRGF